VTFESETEPNGGGGLRVSGSNKQLRDEHVHEAIKKHDSMGDIIEETEDEGGITFMPQTNANVQLSGNKINAQTVLFHP
jgi:hypothetical protein